MECMFFCNGHQQHFVYFTYFSESVLYFLSSHNTQRVLWFLDELGQRAHGTVDSSKAIPEMRWNDEFVLVNLILSIQSHFNLMVFLFMVKNQVPYIRFSMVWNFIKASYQISATQKRLFRINTTYYHSTKSKLQFYKMFYLCYYESESQYIWSTREQPWFYRMSLKFRIKRKNCMSISLYWSKVDSNGAKSHVA